MLFCLLLGFSELEPCKLEPDLSRLVPRRRARIGYLLKSIGTCASSNHGKLLTVEHLEENLFSGWCEGSLLQSDFGNFCLTEFGNRSGNRSETEQGVPQSSKYLNLQALRVSRTIFAE
jgi:hypothetical protein